MEFEAALERCRRVAAETGAILAGVEIQEGCTTEELRKRVKAKNDQTQWLHWMKNPASAIEAVKEDAERLRRRRQEALRNIRKLEAVLAAG